MKKMHSEKRFFYMLAVVMILAASAVTAAANPSEYVSLGGEYGKSQLATGIDMLPAIDVKGYLPKFRVFIPPGTTAIFIAIYEYGNQTAIARHEIPPTTFSIPAGYFDASSRTLDAIQASDQIISENKEGKLTIINQGIPGGVSQEQAGWLYVFVTGGKYSSIYHNKVSLMVDATIYNDWYDHLGTNTNGSINWANDVEGVVTYGTPNPLPGIPVASPETGSWTTAPQDIVITSANADAIFANYTVATGDAVPELPTPPTSQNALSKKTGSSWTLPLEAMPIALITQYKYQFVGKNTHGDGNVSTVYSYTLDLTPYTPDAVVATPGKTSRTPLDIAVSSVHSTQIHYSLTTDNGLVLSEPNSDSPFVPGPSGGTFQLSGVAGQSTTYRVLYKAFNQNGGNWSVTSPEYTYVIDRTPLPPDVVLVDPPDLTGSWTSAHAVTISSVGATQIYASAVTTTDGSTPADPVEPSEFSSVVVNGESGVYNVPSSAGKKTITKVRFRGYNVDGFGPAQSTIYSYTTELPVGVVPPGSVSVTPTGGAWADAAVHYITVSCSGADYIYAKMSITYDGTEPSAPVEPVNAFGTIRRVNGTSGQIAVPSSPGKTTRAKIIFAGANAGGVGQTSPVYLYSTSSLSTPAPGSVTVTPGSTNWTSATWTAGQAIAVTSANATQIEYTYNITTDGTEPAEPSSPSDPIGNPFFKPINTPRGVVNGATGNYYVPSAAGATTKIKIKFCGKNATAYGTDTQTYSYSIDLKTPVLKPAAVVVTPGDTNWTSATWTTGQKISVSSKDAKQIHYVYTKTEDGTEPAEPLDPSTATATDGQTIGIISVASVPIGYFPVPSKPDTNTRVKIRFCGKNGDVYGASTITYSYRVNLKTAYKSGDKLTSIDAKAVPGLDITPIVLRAADGILDPGTKFLIIDSANTYSVADLIANYLRTTQQDASIKVEISAADGVMTISSPNFGGYVYTVIIGSLMTSAESDDLKLTDTGNIEICTKNIKITLYPACADLTVFKQTVAYYGWDIAYGPEHVILVTIPNTPEFKLVFRFQFYADRNRLSDTGISQCQFDVPANGYGTVIVTYPDGTIQNLVPFIHDTEALAELLATDYKDYNLTFIIDSDTGKILINDAQDNIIWRGMPDYKLVLQNQIESNSVVSRREKNGDLTLHLFTDKGLQTLYPTP